MDGGRKLVCFTMCMSCTYSFSKPIYLNLFEQISCLFVAAFGFCEYKEPESTLRALRLLHDLQIGEKHLLVKVDAKTKAQLEEWKAKKKLANGVRISSLVVEEY